MKKLMMFAGAVALTAFASVAQADTVAVTATDGTWSNAQPGGCCTIDNANPTRTVRWWTNLGQGQSGYDYTAATTPFNATVDGPVFLLGTFVHQNWPILQPVLGTIDLDFSLGWGGFAPNLAGKFSFTHEETPNAAPCA